MVATTNDVLRAPRWRPCRAGSTCSSRSRPPGAEELRPVAARRRAGRWPSAASSWSASTTAFTGRPRTRRRERARPGGIRPRPLRPRRAARDEEMHVRQPAGRRRRRDARPGRPPRRPRPLVPRRLRRRQQPRLDRLLGLARRGQRLRPPALHRRANRDAPREPQQVEEPRYSLEIGKVPADHRRPSGAVAAWSASRSGMLPQMEETPPAIWECGEDRSWHAEWAYFVNVSRRRPARAATWKTRSRHSYRTPGDKSGVQQGRWTMLSDGWVVRALGLRVRCGMRGRGLQVTRSVRLAPDPHDEVRWARTSLPVRMGDRSPATPRS